MKHYYWPFLLFFWSLFTLGQDHIQFKNYTIDEGLSQSSVSTVLQDRLGLLWLGTQDGINRFNGKDFEIFSADQGYDISNEYINTGYSDIKGNLWFGTNNGLTKYNTQLVEFSSFYIDSTKRIEIHAITEDVKGNLWIGTNFGEIYTFNTITNTFEFVNNTVFNSRIIAIRVRNEQIIVVSEAEGVLLTDEHFSQKKLVLPPKSQGEFSINSFIESPEYDLVISTNQGIYHYVASQQKFMPVKGLLSHLTDVNIVDVVYLSNNRLLAASDHSGLFQVIREEDKDSTYVLNYSSDIFQKGSLISNRLNGLYKDNQGIVWISSDQGISSFNPRYLGFKGVGISAHPNNGLPSLNIWGFAESENQRYLYIAADHGISCYDRIAHTYYHYYRENEDNEDFTTLALYVYSNNELLVGGLDGFFKLKINPENRNLYEFEKYKQEHANDVVYTIIPFEQENQFLIGTRRGVTFFDYDKNEFLYLQNQHDGTSTIGPGSIRMIFKDGNDYLASPSSGKLYRIYLENGELKADTKHNFTALNDQINGYFYTVYKDEEDIYWLGTAGEGLIKYNSVTKKIERYDKSTGLPNNVVYGIQSSQNSGKLIWLSTNKGVVAFNRKTGQIQAFTDKDGLMSNELNLGASFVAKNGEIYFGGIQGFNYFNPLDAFAINTQLKVYFTDLELENEVIFPSENGILTQNIAFTKDIRLAYNQRSLKLKFFANDLNNPERIEFKYVLKGKNKIEEELGFSNEIRFTGLAPGVYELEVYARASNESWNTYPAKLIIELERPFWLKWWFYVLSVLLIAFTSLYRVRKRIDESRRRQVRLEMRIAERTRELRKKNEQIQQQKNRLVQQTEELEREKEKSERLLNNVLPKETASQLKKDGRAAARDFKKVSIMFTDFVGFSRIAEGMKAKDLVSILDTHFRKFDKIIENNNLEKIKTIGDAYMAAGGVPIRNKTNPINTALAAVQIKYYMLDFKEQQLAKGEPYWQLRIGINTGSVSAGVIGTKRYAYDIWGSAVNRAQLMEQESEPEKIAITQDTFDLIEPYFECKRRGKIKTKSGVIITMYELVSIKPELSIDGRGIEPNEAFHKLVNLHHFSKINYTKAERFIMNKLRKELSPKLHYHSYIHSMDVTRQAERIAIGEGITDEDLFLLKSAASYHDAGFVEQYDKNEPVGARMAAEILPNFGYTDEDIKRIQELIYVTEVPHQPKDLLEEIICDADLDYLGRDDFHEISDKLRLELREHGKIDSDRAWDQMQVKFFKMHRYFTKTSIETRLPKKMQNLEEIKQRIKEDKYKD